MVTAVTASRGTLSLGSIYTWIDVYAGLPIIRMYMRAEGILPLTLVTAVTQVTGWRKCNQAVGSSRLDDTLHQ